MAPSPARPTNAIAEARRRARRGLVAALFALAACTSTPRTAPPDVAAPSPAAAPAPAPAKTASAATAGETASAPAPGREEHVAPAVTSAPAAKAPAAPTKPAAAPQKSPARTAPPKSPPAATAKAPPAAAPAAVATTPATAPAPRAAPLDIKSLEQRLRETNAIGVMTKLSLKNQVDDLLEKFREYHRGQLKVSLAELRHPYELLLMKVLSLLQDGDAALAQAINASRDAIWALLADRDKFFQYTS